jgi:hypothetical protein
MIAKMIEEKIDTLDTHISWVDIAKTLNLTKSAISKFKNNGTELGFDSLLKLSKLLYHKNYKDVMSEWCTKIRKPSNVKYALEFLSANRKINHLESSINELLAVKSETLNEIAHVYSVILMNHRGNFNAEYISRANSLKPKIKENKVLLSISKVYYYNKVGNISKVLRYLEEAKIYNNLIEDSFLKEIYQHRIDEMWSVILLFNQCNTVEARSFAEKLLNNDFYCDTFKADSYYRIGMSFLFESPDLCVANLQKAANHYRKDGLHHLADDTEKESITLAKIHWGLVKDSTELENISSKTHYEAKYGNKVKAEELSTRLNQASPFTKYYQGIAKSDGNLLLESLLMFKNNGNMFYSRLPIEALSQYPALTNVVELILNDGGN